MIYGMSIITFCLFHTLPLSIVPAPKDTSNPPLRDGPQTMPNKDPSRFLISVPPFLTPYLPSTTSSAVILSCYALLVTVAYVTMKGVLFFLSSFALMCLTVLALGSWNVHVLR